MSTMKQPEVSSPSAAPSQTLGREPHSQWPEAQRANCNIVSYKRKKRKSPPRPASQQRIPSARGRMKSCPPPARVALLWLTLALLACDRSVASDPTEEQPEQVTALRQRFLEEPSDTFALVGQPADFNCKVVNKRAPLGWSKDNFGFATETVDSPWARIYSLIQSYAPDADGSGRLATANSTLRIRNVTINDEGEFGCNLNGADGTTEAGKRQSRRAKLTVLQPPSELRISARALDDHDEPDQQSQSVVLVAEGQASGQQQQQQEEEADGQSVRLKVRQNTRLRLECSANQAKPNAKLVWLEHQKWASPDEPANASYLEELIRVDPNQPKLSYATLAWTLTVPKELNGRRFTCEANHEAFELEHQFPALHRRRLRRRLTFEVLYEPQIRLTKDQPQPVEGGSVEFNCEAEARPKPLAYSWFIDDQLVANESSPRLLISPVTRQMHSREVKCRVSNEVGASSAVLKLAVRYAAAFVSHLMPASLQPAEQPAPVDGGRPGAGSDRHSLRWPSQSELALAGQLAQSFRIGQDVQLRCDFDANPRVQQVEWFRVASDYNIQQNVAPEDSDDFIEFGLGQAVFSWPAAEPAAEAGQADKLRRHISALEFGRAHSQLDLDEMSRELLSQLAEYELAGGRNSTPGGAPAVEPIAASAASQTLAPIFEPLAWRLLEASSRRLQLQPRRASGAGSHRLGQRLAQITSSQLSLAGAREDATGKYVCRARPADGFAASARSTYLVNRQSPRIVSAREQYYPLGSASLQLECLCQIHAVLDNQTSVGWSRNGQPLEADPSQRRYEITERRSPDMLYVRSRLAVHRSDYRDFGKYECTITNSMGSDYMTIQLKPSAPTGEMFGWMVAFVLGGVGLIVGLCMLTILFAKARLEPREKAKLMAQQTRANFDQKSATGSDSDTCTVKTDDHCDAGSQRPAYKQSQSPVGSHHEPKLGLSQRQASLGQRANNFAAIHETLGPKLQLGQLQQLQQQQPGQSPLVAGSNKQADDSSQSLSARLELTNETISEIEPKSLLDRLLSRLTNRPAGTRVSSRRLKSRPVISNPMSSLKSHANLRRSSLSTSLSALGSSNADASSSSPAEKVQANSVNLNHVDGAHLVSSKANLIQDSATPSDGTASSGRSSSISNNLHQNQHHQQNILNQQQQQLYGSQDNHISYMQQAMWKTLDPTDQRPAKINPCEQAASSADCGLYMNGAYQMPDGGLYANGYPTGVDMGGGYASPIGPATMSWLQPQQSIIASHYNQPHMLINGNDVATSASYCVASQQAYGHPCYATPSIAQQFADGNFVSHQQSAFESVDPNQVLQMHQVGDDGDAYLESHYGTLLSRSSAYKKLGLAPASANRIAGSVNSQQNGYSSSNSPGSMTTHANESMFQQPIADDIQSMAPNDESLAGSQVTVVQSEGATTSTTVPAPDDNGLATHV